MSNKQRRLVLALTALLLTAACSGQSAGTATEPDASSGPTELDAPEPGLSRVVLIGDSVAEGQAVPLAAAFGASDIEFHSMASTGGGNVVGPNSEEVWETVSEGIASASPSTVIYQPTTFDWGDEEEQRAAYERLLATVTEVDGDLVFVTAPPIEPDEFYEPHMAELERTSEVARSVAEDSDGRAVVLDASEVWGDTYQRTVDGEVHRSSDGIHTCPQGAAEFTSWLLTELVRLYPDFTPPDPEEWANTGWSGDDSFVGC